jgi:uncharacterized protein
VTDGRCLAMKDAMSGSGTLIPLQRIARLIRRPRSLLGNTGFRAAGFSPRLQTRLLVLQATPFCNLDCDYCYLPDRQNSARMSLDTVRLCASRLVEDRLVGPRLTVVWHAGEPLVLGPNYYEQAFRTLAQALGPDCQISHSFQTNGTLIDERWCEFFSRHPIRIGISVDGPADLHDRHRRTRHGKGTHHHVMSGMARLRRHGIPFHAIAVVGQESLAHAADLRNFFVDAGVQEVGFNFDEIEGEHLNSSLQDHEDEHLAFLAETLALSMQSNGRYRVRELVNAVNSIAHDSRCYEYDGRQRPDNGQVIPFAIISVGWNGDFSTFSPEFLGQRHEAYEDFVLGNVCRSSYLAAAAGNEVFDRLWHDILRGVAACEASCAYFKYCGGGAPVNKLYENGSVASAETLYCRSMIKRPFDTVLQALESDAPDRVTSSPPDACGRRRRVR